MQTSPEQRLYDAAARCSRDQLWADSNQLIAAATQARAAGVDSPSLRKLAAAPQSARSKALHRVLLEALDELLIPRPDASPGQNISGTPYARLPTDSLRLEIVPSDACGFEVLIHVNDVEITAAGAGMGMHPFDLLVPTNRLIATTEPRHVWVARCTCGEPGCGSTEARITRIDEVVHWDWYVDPPLGHGVSFDAAAYDAEVGRIAADQGWQGPVDTASRLVLEEVDRDLLSTAGLQLSWAAADHRDPDKFLVALFVQAEKFQVFLRFPLRRRSPEEVADEVVRTLRRRPQSWSATFRSMVVGQPGRPSMAGWRWRSEDPW